MKLTAQKPMRGFPSRSLYLFLTLFVYAFVINVFLVAPPYRRLALLLPQLSWGRKSGNRTPDLPYPFGEYAVDVERPHALRQSHSGTLQRLKGAGETDKMEEEKNDGSTSNRVFIWNPQGECNGALTAKQAEHDSSDIPYAMVREAVIDRRIVANRYFVERSLPLRSTPFIRFILYVTVHLSAELTNANATAMLSIPPEALDMGPGLDLQVAVDYVIQSDLNLNAGVFTRYTPGMRNRRGYAVSEWQVSVSVVPALYSSVGSQRELEDLLLNLSKGPRPARLSLALQLNRFDGVRVPFKPWMSLGCVMGWAAPTAYPPSPRLNSYPRCARSAVASNGAVLFSGSSLYGRKNSDARYYFELAHFAARGLHGPLKFSTVVITISSRYSISDMAHRCGDEGGECRKRIALENERHFEGVRDAVEKELAVLGVPRSSYGDVMLVPGCRLGSHAAGVEAELWPCGLSFNYGQYSATLFAYAMLSPFYKWAVSLDLDEAILDAPGGNKKARSGPAAELLDLPEGASRGFFTFKWLTIGCPHDTVRNFTTDLMQGRKPELKPRGPQGGATDCSDPSPTGKSAVRCDHGLGFNVHKPLIRKRIEYSPDLVTSEGHSLSYFYRTWHARRKVDRNRCLYIHARDQIEATAFITTNRG